MNEVEKKADSFIRAIDENDSFQDQWERHEPFFRWKSENGICLGHYFKVETYKGRAVLNDVIALSRVVNPEWSVPMREANGFFIYLAVGDVREIMYMLESQEHILYGAGVRHDDMLVVYPRKVLPLFTGKLERKFQTWEETQ